MTRMRSANRKGKETLPPAPHGISPCRSSIYITAKRDLVSFMMEDRKSLDVLKWTRKNVRHPDEAFFCNIYHNKILGAPSAYTGTKKLHQSKQNRFLKTFSSALILGLNVSWPLSLIKLSVGLTLHGSSI